MDVATTLPSAATTAISTDIDLDLSLNAKKSMGELLLDARLPLLQLLKGIRMRYILRVEQVCLIQ